MEDLEQHPPQVPPENPKYAGLANEIVFDPAFNTIRDELNTAHKLRVFGTLDFTTVPAGEFAKLASSDENMNFSADAEAEREFRRRFPDKAKLYDEQKEVKLYRDPDGVLNRDRDPVFRKFFETDERGQAWTREEGMRRFVMSYPEKAAATRRPTRIYSPTSMLANLTMNDGSRGC